MSQYHLIQQSYDAELEPTVLPIFLGSVSSVWLAPLTLSHTPTRCSVSIIATEQIDYTIFDIPFYRIIK